MSRPWRHSRRAAYSTRAHDLSTRPERDAGVVWYHGPAGDHAFGAGTSGYLRSRCGAVRWDVRMVRVEGTVHACPVCAEIVAAAAERDAPIVTESELRLLDGNR